MQNPPGILRGRECTGCRPVVGGGRAGDCRRGAGPGDTAGRGE